jgi:hypothetical protein
MQRVHLLLWFTCLHQKTKCQVHSPSLSPIFPTRTASFPYLRLRHLDTHHTTPRHHSHLKPRHLVSTIHIPPLPSPHPRPISHTYIPNHTMTRGYPHHHYNPSQPPSHVSSSPARPRPATPHPLQLQPPSPPQPQRRPTKKNRIPSQRAHNS